MFNRAAYIFNVFKNTAARPAFYYQAPLESKPPTGFDYKNPRFPHSTMFTNLNSESLDPSILVDQPYPDKLLYLGSLTRKHPSL
ncbi:hypothetical protein K439DRAFT_1628612 [Ramaria rubella]|nr:hypothetical protein K439DRAFT_1628612 [Ramaria rubella]